MVYLSQEQVSNLQAKPSKYIFKVDNRSISEGYFLSDFWAHLVKNYCPSYLAPNLLTTTGAFFGLLGFFIYVNWAPASWALATTAVFFFLYQTFDGCDGKQARATGSGSQLGELLDHGVDALILSCFSYVLADLCRWNPDHWYYIGLYWVFFTAHWEHFHTDCFYMGYLNACDGQNMIIFALVVASYVGRDVFHQPMWILSQYSWHHFFNFQIYANSILGTLRNIYNTVIFVAQNKRSVFECITDLLPVTILTVVYHLFVTTNNNLWQQNHLLLVSVGAIMFATLNSTLNAARVTSVPFSRFSIQFMSTLFAMLLTLLLPNHLDLVWFAFFWCLMTYCHFVYHLVNDMADGLNINIFKIKPK